MAKEWFLDKGFMGHLNRVADKVESKKCTCRFCNECIGRDFERLQLQNEELRHQLRPLIAEVSTLKKRLKSAHTAIRALQRELGRG